MQMTIMAFGIIYALPSRGSCLFRYVGALAGPPISGAIKQHHPTFHEVGIYAGEEYSFFRTIPLLTNRPGSMVVASVALLIASKYAALGRVIGGKF